eukprot:scaffold43971_cov80-Cyclotella_meneghiniana.AAC.3
MCKESKGRTQEQYQTASSRGHGGPRGISQAGNASRDPVASCQLPVAKPPHFAPAHVGAARQAPGIRYGWQAFASQSSHSLLPWQLSDGC